MHFSASNQQGDPNDGPDELEPNLSYLNHTPTIFSKFTHFLPFFFVVSALKKCVKSLLCVFISLKIILWVLPTILHGW